MMAIEQHMQIRFIIACPQSGSTLLMRVIAESKECAFTSRLVLVDKSEEMGNFRPDYSIFETPKKHKVYKLASQLKESFLTCKQEIKGECSYDIFSPEPEYALVRPKFLIRDPVRMLDSCKHVGWTDTQNLIDGFTKLFDMLRKGPSQSIFCLIYERLIRDPQSEIRNICARWGIPYSDAMLNLSNASGSTFLYGSDRERRIHCEEKARGLCKTVKTSSSVEPEVPYHGLLSNAEQGRIQSCIGLQYLSCWTGESSRLQAILHEKT